MNKKFYVSLLGFSLIFLMAGMVFAQPNGGSITAGDGETAQATAADSHTAQAGNVTELTVTGIATTTAWQGYFGNVSGGIELANAAGNVMYNWSLASPEGEIYASISNSVVWSSIECLNWATNGADLESDFGIDATDADGINETFFAGNGHDAFYTNSQEFTEGECMSARVFDNSGAGVDNHFEEVLLWDGSNAVFASLLEEDALGFDDNSHDFEMLVPEDGHDGDTSTTPYYFYVELE